MRCRKFLEILKLELDDALEDFDALIGLYRRKNAEGHLTDYVLQQNVAFVETEKQALRDCRRALDERKICDDVVLEDLRNELEKEIDAIIHDHDLPAPAREYIRRKVDKVFQYVGTGGLDPG
ncbi:MAG: hypothetical protein GVY14_08470 [Spirochaetes bacterium]|jgi:hypothetical protein|nr:hypothetical protein [Spirochaetota bacterium]